MPASRDGESTLMHPKFWIGNILAGFGITRDSLVLAWSKWIGLAVALGPSAMDLTQYGVPHKVITAIRLTAFVVSVSSAQHRTSSLAGDSK